MSDLWECVHTPALPTVVAGAGSTGIVYENMFQLEYNMCPIYSKGERRRVFELTSNNILCSVLYFSM